VAWQAKQSFSKAWAFKSRNSAAFVTENPPSVVAAQIDRLAVTNASALAVRMQDRRFMVGCAFAEAEQSITGTIADIISTAPVNRQCKMLQRRTPLDKWLAAFRPLVVFCHRR
jgi:hypothetical protein